MYHLDVINQLTKELEAKYTKNSEVHNLFVKLAMQISVNLDSR